MYPSVPYPTPPHFTYFIAYIFKQTTTTPGHFESMTLGMYTTTLIWQSCDSRVTTPTPLSTYNLADDIDGINMEEVPCNILNMEFFDRLWNENMVDKETNEMIKSKRDSWGDIPLTDEVRKVCQWVAYYILCDVSL